MNQIDHMMLIAQNNIGAAESRMSWLDVFNKQVQFSY